MERNYNSGTKDAAFAPIARQKISWQTKKEKI